jgi:hypothetical protein
MRGTISSTFLSILLASIASVASGADSVSGLQYEKERALVEELKKLVTCKNSGVYQDDGDLYCFLNFRGLRIEFAGVNAKGGGSIYITALGQNQTVSPRGSRCILIIFGDKDLKGIGDAHILFRKDGVITHNVSNKTAWSEC